MRLAIKLDSISAEGDAHAQKNLQVNCLLIFLFASLIPAYSTSHNHIFVEHFRTILTFHHFYNHIYKL
jgi:hypothetical protein